jgi:hypothetical protein
MIHPHLTIRIGRRHRSFGRRLDYGWMLMRRMFRKVLRTAGTPHSIALGVAIGFVVGWTPTVGFQMMIAAPICLLLRANFIAAVPPIWLTNPATLIPIYGFNYWVGLKLVGGPGLGEFREAAGRVLAALEQADVTWAETGRQLLDLTVRFMAPLWVGCLVVGFSLAIPAYFFAYRAVDRFRVLRERRRARLLAAHGLAEHHEPGIGDGGAGMGER